MMTPCLLTILRRSTDSGVLFRIFLSFFSERAEKSALFFVSSQSFLFWKIVADHINITGDSGMTAEMKTYYEKKLLENLYPQFIWNRESEKTMLPSKNGKQVEWRRIAKFATNKTPLTEATPPDAKAMSVSTVTATVAQHGGATKFSDLLQMTSIDPIIEKAVAETIPQDAIAVLEGLTANVATAGTSVRFAGTNTARSTVQDSDVLTFSLVQKAERDLKKKSVPRFPDGYYHSIISPDAEYDLKQDTKWLDAYKYANRVKEIYPDEIGMISSTRFFSSPYAKRFAHQGAGTDALHTTLDDAAAAGQKVIPLTATTGLAAGDLCTIRKANGAYEQEVTIDSINAGVSVTIVEDLEFAYASADKFDKGDDVFGTVVYGPGAWGTVSIDGMQGGQQVGAASFAVIIKPVGSAGSADPINQIGSIGWKAAVVNVILDQDRIERIEHGATDGVS